MPKSIRIYPKTKPIAPAPDETKIVPNVTTVGVPAPAPVIRRATRILPPPKPKAKPKAKAKPAAKVELKKVAWNPEPEEK